VEAALVAEISGEHGAALAAQALGAGNFFDAGVGEELVPWAAGITQDVSGGVVLDKLPELAVAVSEIRKLAGGEPALSAQGGAQGGEPDRDVRGIGTGPELEVELRDHN
jgi:hypothetical protein